MSNRILVATRKGLFTLERNGNDWGITRTDFLADHVSMVLPDARDNRLYAALDHGHFGVKMHRAPAWSATFEECPAPAYPEKPPGEPERDQWGKEVSRTFLAHADEDIQDEAYTRASMEKVETAVRHLYPTLKPMFEPIKASDWDELRREIRKQNGISDDSQAELAA